MTTLRPCLPLRAAATLLIAWACCATAAAQGDGAAARALAASPAATLPASLPVRRDLPLAGEATSWGSSLVLLALTGGAGAWVLWWRSARARTNAAKAARSEAACVLRLASQPLTQHASVHAVQWNGEEFLLGCTAQQVTLLSRRPVDALRGDAS